MAIGRNMAQPHNIIFWGAGATAALGIRTTDAQTRFIKRITGADAPGKLLDERVREALAPNDMEPWRSALLDLITILGDSDDAYDNISSIDHLQLDAMRRNWQDGAGDRSPTLFARSRYRVRFIGQNTFLKWGPKSLDRG
jgi:hypothetical protein